VCDQGGAFDHGLREQEAIKGIVVVQGQVAQRLDVFEVHAQLGEATGFDRMGDAAGKTQPSQRALDCHLPSRGHTDQYDICPGNGSPGASIDLGAALPPPQERVGVEEQAHV